MYNVVVLLSTYNGEKYLDVQIKSILNQEKVCVTLLVRDDGSTDSTIDILKKYEKKNLLKWYSGENIGPAKSFVDLLRRSGNFDFYSFADQDDYWFKDKLYKACNILSQYKDNSFCLYGSEYLPTDRNLQVYLKKKISKTKFPNSFGEAVVKTSVSGCTIVINKYYKEYLANCFPSEFSMHDAIMILIAFGINANISFDNTPSMYYRQHNDNFVGYSHGFYQKWLKRFTEYPKHLRSQDVYSVYSKCNEFLSDESRSICLDIIKYHNSFLNKLNLLKNHKIRNKNKLIDLKYRISVIFGLY